MATRRASESRVGHMSGLVSLYSTDFTNVSTISAEKVFVPDYKQFKILITFMQSTTSRAYYRFRAGSTDITAMSYVFAGSWVQYDVGSFNSFCSSFQNKLPVFAHSGLYGGTIAMELYLHTTDSWEFNVQGHARDNGRTVNGAGQIDAIGLDGLTLWVDSGTASGSISVFGYATN